MAHLKGIQDLLRQKHSSEEGKLWSPIRKKNLVKLHQTPDVWGHPMTPNGVMEGTRDSVSSLAGAMENVIARGHSIVDIISLDPPRGTTPDGVFWDAISGGIQELSRRRGAHAKVRFMFGFPPGQGRENHHTRFKKALSDLWNGLDEEARPTLVYGVYCTLVGLYWNHAKIFASDAGIAVVGGHNLYDADYNQYPPVHDVSIEVWGRAAIDAQNFAAYLWEYGGISDYSAKIEGSLNPFATSWNPLKSESVWNPLSRTGLVRGGWSTVSNPISNRAATVVDAWQVTERGWEALSPEGYSQLFPGGGYTDWEDVAFERPKGNGYHKADILTVGRMGGWAHQMPTDQNASDYMKEYLFQHADEAIRIAHQDIIAIPAVPGFTKVKHSTCQELAAALQRNGDLQVQVIVSAPWGCGRMDEYTNVPYGPQSAANYIMYYATKWGTTWAKERPKLYPLWKRLFVAPFYFTDKLPQGHYFWPKADEVEGCEGGLAKQGYPKSVGNHSKIMIVDGTMVVGSDNHYPHPLAEVNLVLEGDIVQEFMEKYWEPLWHFSEPHAVQQWTDDSMLSGE